MNDMNDMMKLHTYLFQQGKAKLLGQDCDYTPIRALCEKLKKENPDVCGVFVTDGTDSELICSVSDFFDNLLKFS